MINIGYHIIMIIAYPFNIVMQYPWVTVIPSTLFGLFFLFKRKSILLINMILWAAYGIYEYRMQVWSRTVTAPIRVDLILIMPILYAFTITGILAGIGGVNNKWKTVFQIALIIFATMTILLLAGGILELLYRG